MTRAVAPATKLVPVTEIADRVVAPEGTEAGLSVRLPGAGFRTGTVKAAEVPPPGVGLKRVIARGLALAVSAAARTTLSAVPFATVVGRELPLTWAEVAGTKPVPVRLNVGVPALSGSDAGFAAEMPGAGLSTSRVLVAPVSEVEPPAFVSMRESWPPLARRLAGTVAVSVVALTSVTVIGAPLIRRVVLASKPVPVTVSVTAALPAGTVEGEMPVRVSGTAGGTDVRGREPPPQPVKSRQRKEAVQRIQLENTLISGLPAIIGRECCSGEDQ